MSTVLNCELQFPPPNIDFLNNCGALMLEKLGFGVIVIDSLTHQIVYVNPKLLEMSGFTFYDLVGRECHKLLCPAEVGKCPITDLGREVDNSERTMLMADHNSMSIIKTVVPLVVDNRRYLVESIIDNRDHKIAQEEIMLANQKLRKEIIQRLQIEKDIHRMSFYDHLTGLPNRSFFSSQLNNALSYTSSVAGTNMVMFLDLDGFKMINDTMGHSTGDRLLIEVSRRLTSVMGKSDLIGRTGGDEFILSVDGVTDITAVETITGKVLNSFKTPFQIDQQEIFITASIGVAISPTDGNSAEALLKNADLAMYNAKNKGRNQWSLCTSTMRDQVNDMIILSNNLYRALERNELELYYQPQISTRTQKIIGLEALIRWNHPQLGLVSPGRFIPIAEQTGLIHPIGEWIMRTACGQNKAWRDAGLINVPIAVNLSPLQFQNPNILELLTDILSETSIEPDNLEIEITESVTLADPQNAEKTLQGMKKLGITIAIDDFGTEYSSLNYLKILPIDRIKIAMPFIHGIDQNKKDEAIIKTIITLAKSMGMRVIAEGVEQKNQLSFLEKHDCDEIQGYIYYKPMPAAYIKDLLRS